MRKKRRFEKNKEKMMKAQVRHQKNEYSNDKKDDERS